MSNTSTKIKKTIIWILTVLLLGVICVSLFWAPQYEYSGEAVADEVQQTADIDGAAIDSYANCKVDADGHVSEPTEGAYIRYDGINSEGNIIDIVFAEPFEEDTEYELAIDYGEGFEEGYNLSYTLSAGESEITTTAGLDTVQSIRLRIYRDYTVENIGIYYSGSHIEKTYDPAARRGIYYGLLLAAALIALLAFLDRKFGWTDRLAQRIRMPQKSFLLKALFIVALVILTHVVFTCLWGSLDDSAFRFDIFCMCVAAMLGFTIANIRTIGQKPEQMLLFGLLVSGIAITALLPFYQVGWDIFYHYRGTIRTAALLGARYTGADTEIIGSLYGSDLFPASYGLPRDVTAQTIAELNSLYDCYMGTDTFSFSLSRFAAGVAVAVLRMLGCSFYWVYTLGKLPNLILYALICYFGMKRLHSGKILYAVIALFPTSIFIACNYSYDFWLTGFALMGMGYFVGMSQEREEKAEWKDLIIMIACFTLACIPKSVYLALMLIPFFLNPKKLENKKLYYGMCVAAIGLIVVILGVNMVINLTSRDIVSTATGTNIVPSQQLIGVLKNIPGYIVILVKFMIGYLKPDQMERYISNFNNRGIGSYTIVFQIILAAAVLFDKDDCDKKSHSLLTRAAMLVLFLGTIALCASTMYLVYTDVGAQEILGCQNRYIIPVLYPGLAVLTGGGIVIKKGRNVINTVCMIALTAAVFATIFELLIPYYF